MLTIGCVPYQVHFSRRTTATLENIQTLLTEGRRIQKRDYTPAFGRNRVTGTDVQPPHLTALKGQCSHGSTPLSTFVKIKSASLPNNVNDFGRKPWTFSWQHCSVRVDLVELLISLPLTTDSNMLSDVMLWNKLSCLLQLPTHKLENYMTRSLYGLQLGHRLLLREAVRMVSGFAVKEDDLKGVSGFDVLLKWKPSISAQHWVVINVSHAKTLSPWVRQSFPCRDHDFPLSGMHSLARTHRASTFP